MRISETDFVVLEDDAVIAADIEQMLLEAGARSVALAASLDEARRLVGGGSVAILDLGNDDEERIALAADTCGGGGCCVLLTGSDDVAALNPVLAGLVVLTKPFATSAFLEAVETALQRAGGGPDASPP